MNSTKTSIINEIRSQLTFVNQMSENGFEMAVIGDEYYNKLQDKYIRLHQNTEMAKEKFGNNKEKGHFGVMIEFGRGFVNGDGYNFVKMSDDNEVMISDNEGSCTVFKTMKDAVSLMAKMAGVDEKVIKKYMNPIYLRHSS